MNILKLSGSNIPITADNTNITADNDQITVDSMTQRDDGFHEITIVPREYPSNVILELSNELDGELITISNAVVVNSNGLMTIVFELDSVKDSETYRITVKNTSNKLIWRGLLFATEQSNLQEYKMNVPNSNGIIIM